MSVLCSSVNGADAKQTPPYAGWRDPATGYLRRAVSPPGANPELVHVELPPKARLAYPSAAYAQLSGQCIWVLRGALVFRDGAAEHRLAEGDCLALGPPADCALHNASDEPCTYLVVVSRSQQPSSARALPPRGQPDSGCGEGHACHLQRGEMFAEGGEGEQGRHRRHQEEQ